MLIGKELSIFFSSLLDLLESRTSAVLPQMGGGATLEAPEEKEGRCRPVSQLDGQSPTLGYLSAQQL